MKCFFRYSESLFLLMLDQRMKGICQWGKIVNKESPKDQTRKIYGYNIKQVLDAFVPSVNSNKFPSKRGKVTIDYYLIGCKRDMFGSQPFEFAEGRVIRFKRHGHHCLSFPPGCKNGAGQFYLSTLNTWCCCWWR